MIYIVAAHPYPSRSRACRALLTAVDSLPGVAVNRLYDRYPDFDIDVASEQAALRDAELVVWLHPVYWYSVPGLLKHWFDRVLARGWAFGSGGDALHGKDCLWAATSGGGELAYTAAGVHRHPLPTYGLPIEETARFCGMNWLPPLLVQGVDSLDDAALAAHGEALRARLAAWQATREPRR